MTQSEHGAPRTASRAGSGSPDVVIPAAAMLRRPGAPDRRGRCSNAARSSPADARCVADTSRRSRSGLPFFSMYLFSLRAFYSMHDTARRSCSTASRTRVNIVLALALYASLGVPRPRARVLGCVHRRGGRHPGRAPPAARRARAAAASTTSALRVLVVERGCAVGWRGASRTSRLGRLRGRARPRSWSASPAPASSPRGPRAAARRGAPGSRASPVGRRRLLAPVRRLAAAVGPSGAAVRHDSPDPGSGDSDPPDRDDDALESEPRRHP